MTEKENSTQKDMIKAAKRAYILTLSQADMTARFAIYLDSGQGLEVLWPTDSHKSKDWDLLPLQVHSRMTQYPAFHFRLNGCGYSKTYELQTMLKDINPDIDVRCINGWSPSNS